jgi:hypothetical protein
MPMLRARAQHGQIAFAGRFLLQHGRERLVEAQVETRQAVEEVGG